MCSKQKQNKNSTCLAKGKRSREPHGSLRKPSRPAVLRDEEAGGTEEGSSHEAGHIQPHPVLGREAFCLSPLCCQLCQKSSNVYTAWLASVLAAEALAGRNARPCWGSETRSHEAFSCLPTHLPNPGFIQQGLGQHRAGKTRGDWPRPLGAWPKHVIPWQQGPGAYHGSPPALDCSGDVCFFRLCF